MNLFPFQKVGADWLSKRKVALLADEMGLGKSAQAAVACDIVGAKRVLVACPAIARYTWLNEFKKFSKMERDFQIITSTKDIPDPEKSCIISYDLLVTGKHPPIGRFDVLILDEVHFLKGIDTLRSHRVWGKMGVIRQAERVWALSGTPAPNHVGELWILLYTFGATGLKYDEFIQRHCLTMISQHGPKIIGNRRENLPELRQALEKIWLRRKIDEVMKDLPEIGFGDVIVPPGKVDIEIASEFMEYAFPVDRREELKQLLQRDHEYATNALSRMGDSSAATIRMIEAMAKSVSTLRKYVGLQKVQPAIELVKHELYSKCYEKLVIFAIHRDVIEQLRTGLAEFKPVTLYGGTPAEKREKNVREFQENPRVKLFIGQVVAAGTNVTLTAANQILFVEKDWVPGNNVQAAMRCRRIGQKKPVFVRFMSIKDSIDLHVNRALKRKEADLAELFD